MGELQRVADARDDAERLRWREAAGAHGLAQVHAIDVLHQQVKEIPRPAGVIDGDDVRMVQPGEHLPLAFETFGKRRIALRE